MQRSPCSSFFLLSEFENAISQRFYCFESVAQNSSPTRSTKNPCLVYWPHMPRIENDARPKKDKFKGRSISDHEMVVADFNQQLIELKEAPVLLQEIPPNSELVAFYNKPKTFSFYRRLNCKSCCQGTLVGACLGLYLFYNHE